MPMKKIGILGTGVVGVTLANGFHDLGYDVQIGGRTKKDIENWTGATDTFKTVAKWADAIVIAVKGEVAEEVVKSVADQLAAKTVIDTTNPISSDPPEDGVLRYFTDMNESLMERLQAIAPKAHFVKAFNSVGNAIMIKPDFSDGPPTMFICGENEAAKKDVAILLQKCGWETRDMGGAKSARAIEPLCMLWCIPGFKNNEWKHAFKLLR